MMKKNVVKVKPGDTIVIRNIITQDAASAEKADRMLLQYTDAKTLVNYFRERDDPNGRIATNQDYMRLVNDTFNDVFEESRNVIPTHSEEAFVNALVRVGLITTTVLH